MFICHMHKQSGDTAGINNGYIMSMDIRALTSVKEYQYFSF